MGVFTVQLKEFAAKTEQKADLLVRSVVTQIAARLDMRSPVGNPSLWKNPAPKGYVGGRFRGNWQLGIGSIPAGETGRIDPSGTAAQAAIAGGVPSEAAGLVFYIANNVPYAQRIEEGHSSQAPSGLVALTAMEFQSIVDSAAGAAQ